MSKALSQLSESLNLSFDKDKVLTDSAFRLKVPTHFIKQMKSGDENDPLLKQILPSILENHVEEGYSQDPVGDLKKNPLPSLIHKYHGRVLLITSPRCHIHCRYCFRRHFPYEEQINKRHWQAALQQIENDGSIHEVILSGGDPFTLSEPALIQLIEQVESIPHIRTLRIHTRSPIVAPEESPQDALIKWASVSRLNKVMVLHCNHANELSPRVEDLLNQYRQSGFQLLNQSVLLKGVNDSVEVLQELSFKLFDYGVLPYYLHQLDKVQGASHFEVSDDTAQQLIEQLRQRLPGYLVPKLVREIPGEQNKTPL